MDIVSQLSAAYTKALVMHPKRTIYANMEKAVGEFPIIKAASNLLEALEYAEKEITAIYENFGTASIGQYGRLDKIRAAIAQAKGE